MSMLEIFYTLLKGLQITVELTVLSTILGAVFAFASGIGRLSKNKLFKYVSIGYIEIFRGTSLIVQLFWLYYVLPLLGISFNAFLIGVFALALNIGAYGAEVVRGALQAVPKGQGEASIALGFSPLQRLWRISLPQATPEMMPTFINLAIQNLKDSAIVSLISLTDLTYYANNLQSLTYETLRIYTVTLFMYFFMALMLSWVLGRLERYLRRWKPLAR
ncbi:ectoine/hydroxyectoine ABC transporter permease subunit EhuC [Acidihalobacter ferrooxydans]|uniref:Ectoine/hydroxyectoine ABC transporter permease subunit EhuC n=1 Tax=Acidihalobacter ferrooxydans TaxID=1765967 RepID=A0A1P8UG43_9GAMM|nr:ectoine/hydroxyectoine ABC transporter permease subunit EhuC [Acidihalobacter ferrooxydans]APZ42785.1 ectoine/hydroxyectoine ABC transporter permease subunit EhuC [Acidihalobacter ferrooxydans]